jgi:hypothetical protein
MTDSLKPELELDKARHEINLMRDSKKLSEFEEHWKEYLRRLRRVWNKACDEFRRNSKWNGWRGSYEQERKKDPLLSYLINARDADEHTIGEITEQVPGGIGINPATGNSIYIEKMEIKNNSISINSPQDIRIDFIPGRVKLLPVTNYGRVYAVPTHHLGNPVDPADVIAIANLGFQYYTEFLKAARSFLNN